MRENINSVQKMVFYNGTEQRPEVEELRLSKAFENHMDEPEIELVCKVYNINQGKNVDLLEHCNVLKEYMFLIINNTFSCRLIPKWNVIKK